MVVVGAATVTVGATTPEVRGAVRQVAARVGVDLESSTDNDCGMSAVVEQRIAADKLADVFGIEIEDEPPTGTRRHQSARRAARRPLGANVR